MKKIILVLCISILLSLTLIFSAQAQTGFNAFGQNISNVSEIQLINAPVACSGDNFFMVRFNGTTSVCAEVNDTTLWADSGTVLSPIDTRDVEVTGDSLIMESGGDRSVLFNSSTGAGFGYFGGNDRPYIDGGGSTIEFVDFAEMYYGGANNYWEFESFRSANFVFRFLNQGSGNATVYGENQLVTGNVAPDSSIQGSIVNDGHTLPVAEPRFFQPIFIEFMNTVSTASYYPFAGIASSSGTVNVNASSVNHPGIVRLQDSTSANGGYWIGSYANAFLLNGTENGTAQFMMPSGKPGLVTGRFGFLDSTSITAPTDGCYWEFRAGSTSTAFANCYNAGSNTSGVYYSFTNDTWYTPMIYVTSSTSVYFALMSETGSLLTSGTITTNIPTTAGRETGFGVAAFQNTTDAASDILLIDWLSLTIDRPLNRGWS